MAGNRPAPLRVPSDDGFWSENPSDNNVGGISIWCKKDDMSYFEWKVRFGDRLEFKDHKSHERWGIYVGRWENDFEQLIHFAPAPGDSMGRPTPELCIESIKTALGNDQVRINNEKDRSYPPSSQADIVDEIRRLLPDSRGKSKHNIVFNESEDFVNYCRYDDLRINFGLVSDWCSSHYILPRIRVGDRLEFKRLAFEHWGIYVGDWEDKHHQVVHLTMSGGMFSIKFKPLLQLQSIEAVLQNHHFRINNERDERHPPFSGSRILGYVKRVLADQSAGYDQACRLFSYNCEDFVNYCRYNTHHSDQVSVPWEKLDRVFRR